MKCDRCAVESEREQFFRVVARSFSKGTLRLCPSCAAKQEQKEQMQAIWITAGLWGFLLLVTWLTPGANLGPIVWNLGLFWIFLFVSTVAHELGHVFFGRLAGMQIMGIEIGIGPVLAEFSLWGFRWQFRAMPLGGFTFQQAQHGARMRLRQALFILGGPLANVLLVLVALVWTGPRNPLPHDFMERFSPGSILLIANAMLVAESLAPYKMATSRGTLPSDGLQLWRTWRGSGERIEVSVPGRYAAEVSALPGQRKNGETIVVYWEGFNDADDIPREYERARSLLLEGKAVEARRIYVKLLGRYSKLEQVRHSMFNNIAYADLLLGDPALMWEADAGSRLALEAQPHVAAFKGTRGAVLVEMGDFDGGLRLLQEAMQDNEDDRNKALNACSIGIAHARRGDGEQYRSYFDLARRLDPKCVLLEREPKSTPPKPGPS